MSAQLPGLVGLQNSTRPSPSVCTRGRDGVLLALAGDEPVPVFAPGGRPPDPDLGAVDDPGPTPGAEVVDDLGRRPQPHAGTDGAASLGEQGPHFADGAGDGGAVHAESAGEHVVCGSVAEVHEGGQEPVDEDQPVLRPAPIARFRGRDASLARCRSCHNGPSSATSSAITPADRPVILRSLMIAARDAFATTRRWSTIRNSTPHRLACTSSLGELSTAGVTRPVGRQFFSRNLPRARMYGSAQPACCRLRGLFSLDTCARRKRST